MAILLKICIAFISLVLMFYTQSALVWLLWRLEDYFNPNSTGFFSAVAFVFNPLGLGLLFLPLTAAGCYFLTVRLLRNKKWLK
ncbi:MAG: hypothetical protein KZQ84_00605 [Candidatus Thiodiazotropha sp. (ex Lucinoma borealis)]|nr:hypothetical protein [Candidatus Thiodiazotropha sp. (ex Lucinoma borealis)]